MGYCPSLGGVHPCRGRGQAVRPQGPPQILQCNSLEARRQPKVLHWLLNRLGINVQNMLCLLPRLPMPV
jgi:hypothetical protein